jgi:hypothetical protein
MKLNNLRQYLKNISKNEYPISLDELSNDKIPLEFNAKSRDIDNKNCNIFK